MALLKVQDKTYSTQALDEVTLKDLVAFSVEAKPYVWADVLAVTEALEGLSEGDASRHPDALLPFAATVWISRRHAGEDIGFWDAIDVPMSQILVIPEPGDRQPGKPKGPKKAQKQTRKASAPVGDLEPASQLDATSTSEPKFESD